MKRVLVSLFNAEKKTGQSDWEFLWFAQKLVLIGQSRPTAGKAYSGSSGSDDFSLHTHGGIQPTYEKEVMIFRYTLTGGSNRPFRCLDCWHDLELTTKDKKNSLDT